MPRKTFRRLRLETCLGGFNEAAARCRGKQLRLALRRGEIARVASMRPRPDAAENLHARDVGVGKWRSLQ